MATFLVDQTELIQRICGSETGSDLTGVSLAHTAVAFTDVNTWAETRRLCILITMNDSSHCIHDSAHIRLH